MEWVEKEEYKEEILECLTNINQALDSLDFFNDISVLANEDKLGRKNWVAEIARVRGQLQSIQTTLNDLT